MSFQGRNGGGGQDAQLHVAEVGGQDLANVKRLSAARERGAKRCLATQILALCK